MVGKLIKDPAGVPTTLTMEGRVVSVLHDRRYVRPRQTMRGSGTVQTRDLYGADYAVGSLVLLVSSSDLITFHGWMADLCAGTDLDCYLDSAGSADARVCLYGTQITERYEPVAPGWWRLVLPVRGV